MDRSGPASGWADGQQAELAAAVGEGNAEGVASIIRASRDRGGDAAVADLVASQAEDTGVSPLMLAAERGHESVVRCVFVSSFFCASGHTRADEHMHIVHARSA